MRYDYAIARITTNQFRFYISAERVPREWSPRGLGLMEGRAELSRIIQEKLVGRAAFDRSPAAVATILSLLSEIFPEGEIPPTHWLEVGIQDSDANMEPFFRVPIRLNDGRRSSQTLAILMGEYVQKYVFSVPDPLAMRLSGKSSQSVTIGILLALFSGWAYERGLSRQAMIALTTLGYRDQTSSLS